jgi:rhodanese-related sulfurtransferase
MAENAKNGHCIFRIYCDMASRMSSNPAGNKESDFSTMLEDALSGRYALVVDARSEREYTEDHVPGAINLPVVGNDEFAEVGTTHKDDKHRAYMIGVSYSLKNMSRAIDEVISKHPRDARMLVYCFRGGKRSKLWLDTLSTIGFKVHRLCHAASDSRCYVGRPDAGKRACSRHSSKWARRFSS